LNIFWQFGNNVGEKKFVLKFESIMGRQRTDIVRWRFYSIQKWFKWALTMQLQGWITLAIRILTLHGTWRSLTVLMEERIGNALGTITLLSHQSLI